MKKARTKKRPVRRSKKTVKRKPKKKKVVKRKLKKKVAKKKPIKRKKIVKKKTKPKRKTKKKVIKKRKPTKRKLAKKRLVKKKKKKIAKRRKPVKKIKKTARRKSAKRRIVKKKIVKRRKTVKRKPVKRQRRKKVVVRRAYSIGNPLEQLFESPVKVQVMKLFFRNPETNFLLKEAAKIMRTNLSMARKEMKRLEKIGFLKSKQISPRKQLFSINSNFDFFNELRELILKASPVSKDKMLKAIKALGKIKLVLLSGIFIGDNVSRADLLIVGDNINQRKLTGFINNLEAEAGTNVSCVVMTTDEFNYRYGMYDRFVRDLLSDKCEFLINRLNI